MKALVRVSTTATWLLGLLGASGSAVCAQAQAQAVQAPAAQVAPAQPSADALFADASAKEVAVRKALAEESPSPTLLRAVRTVVGDYENVVRRYPTSGYCDDALWRAAKLARDAFEEFGESRERTTGLRLLKLLASQYPTSRLAKAAPEQLAWFEAHPATTITTVPTSLPPPRTPSAGVPRPTDVARSTPATPARPPTGTLARAASDTDLKAPTLPPAPTSSAKLVGVKAIRRAVMKDLVRVVIELDDEVAFHDERIDGPPRVFVDLESTRANPALIDRTLRFDADTDIVRQVRVGRHANAVTRIVLEASGVSSYSIYPLYSPFRLVIDCLRAAPLAASASGSPSDTTPGQSGASTSASAATSRADHAPSLTTGVLPTSASKPPTAAAADSDARPAWATTLKKAPPAIPAKPVPWVAPLPSKPEPLMLSAADLAAAMPTTAASAIVAEPATKAAAAPALPAAPPAKNMTGGLSIARQLGLGVSRIVIDPGHGGHDPGAKGPGVTEADLVLDVALRLEKLLAKMPGVEVVLTRRDNTFIPLQERTAIANREGADLFLSIHANASSVPAARGIETYFLNFAANQSAAAVAARENATSDQTMGSLQDVIKAIALNTKVDESRDFATYVQREMLASLKSANGALKDLGVKQAPFVVLIGASMPSILAEISFVTNPQEAKLLKSTTYRQKIAEALLAGVKKYQASLKNVSAVAAQQN